MIGSDRLAGDMHDAVIEIDSFVLPAGTLRNVLFQSSLIAS